MKKHIKIARMIVFLIVMALVLTACTQPAATGDEATAEPAADQSTEQAVQEQSVTELSIALNYTLGAEHGGLIAAQNLGYFEEAGLDVTIVPWSSQTRAESLVSAGTVDLAYLASIDDALVNIAAQRPITVIGATILADPVWIGVKADSDILTPADLDGKTYGGYGSAKEPLLLRALITVNGGEGEFNNVTLGTSAYEAVYNGDVDAALFYSYSDAINAELTGHDMRYFKFSDYDEIPTQYAAIITANSDFLSTHQQEVTKFMAALVRGYEYQLEHPDEIVSMLTESGGSVADEEFLYESIKQVNTLITNDAGQVCLMDMEVWQNRVNFWMDRGFLVDGEGATLEEFPNLDDYVTNSYLPY